MSVPLVTAVIPCHNHRLWVNDAVDSIARQDYPAKRIVVVDDGSKDDSFDVVARRLYKPRPLGNDGRGVVGKLLNTMVDIMVIRHEVAKGPSAARNFGMRAGWENTSVFAFLDSDDLYEPGKISRSMTKFVDAPDHIGVVYSDFDTLNPSGLRIRQYKPGFSRELLLRECIVNCDSLVSRKAIEAVGGFDEELRVAEDYDLWLRISEKFVISHLAEPLVVVRVGEHSSTSTVAKKTWEACWARVMQKVRERATVGQ